MDALTAHTWSLPQSLTLVPRAAATQSTLRTRDSYRDRSAAELQRQQEQAAAARGPTPDPVLTAAPKTTRHEREKKPRWLVLFEAAHCLRVRKGKLEEGGSKK